MPERKMKKKKESNEEKDYLCTPEGLISQTKKPAIIIFEKPACVICFMNIITYFYFFSVERKKGNDK
jgi:hypothetical protein